MFSKTCEYGLRAIIYVAQQSSQNVKVGLSTLVEKINSPQAFTAKVMRQLTLNNMVTSIKGPYGGFIIETDKLDTITLSDVVKIFDGDSVYTSCGLGLKLCNNDLPCPVHFKFIKVRDELKKMLESTTLAMLVNDIDTDRFHLKI